MALGKDGNLFATGDVRGKVNVDIHPPFGLLYQLASQGTTLGLALNPHSRHFHDIRGYYGNASEPIPPAKCREQIGKDDGSSLSQVESLAQSSSGFSSLSIRLDSVTAIAASPRSQLYCQGTDRGTVLLFSVKEGQLAEVHLSKGFFCVEHLVWSDERQHLAFSDSNHKIVDFFVKLEANASAPTREEKIRDFNESSCQGSDPTAYIRT